MVVVSTRTLPHDTVSHVSLPLTPYSFIFGKIVFDLPESQVIVLYPIDRLTKGDTVYAVYPDTTSFYPATVVVSTSKKGPATGPPTLKQPPYVMVQFVDDADEFGITHDKAVPMQHVMIPPPQLLM